MSEVLFLILFGMLNVSIVFHGWAMIKAAQIVERSSIDEDYDESESWKEKEDK